MSIRARQRYDFAPEPDWGTEPLDAAAGLAPGRTGKARDMAEMASHHLQPSLHPLPWGYDEASFVSELQSGSEAAFGLLVTHYHGQVYSLLFGMLSDSADAADVSQEVFLKAFRGIRRFRGSSSLKTWLYRIAVREALNHRRWTWRHLRQQFSMDVEGDEQHAALQIEDGGASPFDSMAAHEVQVVVHGALARVPAVFRSAVILRDLEGLSYEEVAEVLDVSVGTVKSRILRGRAALREVLEPLWLATHAERTFSSHCDSEEARANGITGFAALQSESFPGGGK